MGGNVAEMGTATQTPSQDSRADLPLPLSRSATMQARNVEASAGAVPESWEDLASPIHAASAASYDEAAQQPRNVEASAGAVLDSWEDLASPIHAASNDEAAQQPRNVEASAGVELDSWEALASPTHAPPLSSRDGAMTEQPVGVEASGAVELDSWEDLASPTHAPPNCQDEVCDGVLSSTQPPSRDDTEGVGVCLENCLFNTPADAPHHPVAPFMPPSFDLSSSAAHTCTNVAYTSMAPVMWVPMASSWVCPFPLGTSMPPVFQYPSCMSQSFPVAGAVPFAYDPAQYAQVCTMPMHASDAQLRPDSFLAQQLGGQPQGYAPSAAPCASAETTDASQADDIRRKRSKAGQMNQTIRSHNRLALHRERCRAATALYREQRRAVTAGMAAACGVDDVARERAELSNTMQPSAQEFPLHAEKPICDVTAPDSAKDRTDSQETPIRPAYSMVLCQGLPGRAAPAKSSRHRQ